MTMGIQQDERRQNLMNYLKTLSDSETNSADSETVSPESSTTKATTRPTTAGSARAD